MNTAVDPWLAQVYGTGSAEDLEKTAQYHFLAKLAEDVGLDISQMSEDEIAELAAAAQQFQQQPQGQPGAQQFGQPQQQGFPQQGQQFGQPGQFGQQGQQFAPQQGQPGFNPQMMAGQQQQPQAQQQGQVKEAQQKFEEADFLGRIMAHSYTNELQKIAGIQRAGQVKLAGRFSGAAGKAKGAAKAVAGHVGKHKGAYGAGAAGAGGFAAGRASKRTKEASASAFEKLAFEQAENILNAAVQNGYNPQQAALEQQAQQILAQRQQQMAPQQAQPQAFAPQGQQQFAPQQQMQPEQEPSPEEAFGGALNEQALQILAANGYDVESIIGHLGGEGEGDEGGGEEQPEGQDQQ